MSDPKLVLRRILEDGVRKLGASSEVHLERPKNPEHGDWSTNVALQIARELKRKPREIAEALKQATTDALVDSGITTAGGISAARRSKASARNTSPRRRSPRAARWSMRSFSTKRSAAAAA